MRFSSRNQSFASLSIVGRTSFGNQRTSKRQRIKFMDDRLSSSRYQVSNRYLLLIVFILPSIKLKLPGIAFIKATQEFMLEVSRSLGMGVKHSDEALSEYLLCVAMVLFSAVFERVQEHIVQVSKDLSRVSKQLCIWEEVNHMHSNLWGIMPQNLTFHTSVHSLESSDGFRTELF